MRENRNSSCTKIIEYAVLQYARINVPTIYGFNKWTRKITNKSTNKYHHG